MNTIKNRTMKRKFIITAEMRDLEMQVNSSEISYSRMIEMLCEKAERYAKEYHEAELKKLRVMTPNT